MNNPYEQYKDDPIWMIIDAAMSDLVVNGDLREQTARDYIVGYFVMKIRLAESMDDVIKPALNKFVCYLLLLWPHTTPINY